MQLKSFARAHQELMLVLCAVVFLAGLVAYTAWAIAVLTGNLTRAITVGKGQEAQPAFRFEELKKVKLPGIE
jgi:hypothetical protein